jgi:charged multivesicular body protein 6
MEMIDGVEWAAINLEAMKALKSGNDALNRLHEEMTPDDVAALLDETNEAIEIENQINNLLAGQLEQYDSEELEAELAELMGETKPIKNNKEEKVPILPDAPDHDIRVAELLPSGNEEEAEVEDKRVLVAST